MKNEKIKQNKFVKAMFGKEAAKGLQKAKQNAQDLESRSVKGPAQEIPSKFEIRIYEINQERQITYTMILKTKPVTKARMHEMVKEQTSNYINDYCYEWDKI